MKQFIWYLLFAIMVFVSYQGYVNSKDDPETEAMSRDAVCALDKECGLVAGSQANVRVTDIMSRNYQWNAKAGSYVATCKREYVFVGHWKCEARPGQIGRSAALGWADLGADLGAELGPARSSWALSPSCELLSWPGRPGHLDL